MPSVVEFSDILRRHIKGLKDKHPESALTFTDITTNNVSTTLHGFVPKAPNDTQKFLRGDATWAGATSGTLATEQATTSGTSIDFTGIPVGTKQIIVMVAGLSTNGTSLPIIQLGDSGGVEVTGYVGGVVNASGAGTAISVGFPLAQAGLATAVITGQLTLYLENSTNNTWVGTGIFGRSDAVNSGAWVGGSKALSPGPLDRVRLTTVNGSDAFDAGVVNIQYS